MASSAGEGSQSEARAPNELSLGWKKIEVLGRPIGGFFTAVAVAGIGWFGQSIMSNRETELTKRAAIEQDTRLYTELMSRREESDSSLRKDMFTQILGQFLSPTNEARDLEAAVSDRLLKLELLALNFGDSLSLSPLFLELRNDVEEFHDSPFWKVKRDRFRRRLRSLARRVSVAQLAALSPAGVVFELDVPPAQVSDGRSLIWPDNEVEQFLELNEGESEEGIRSQRATHELRGIERTYSATFSEADPELKTVEVELTILESPREGEEVNLRPTEMSFELNFFNFPMVDNTRLSGDQRFALVMEKFDDDNIHVIGVCFPGMYASLRDKPFLDDIIEKLRREEAVEAEAASAPEQPAT